MTRRVRLLSALCLLCVLDAAPTARGQEPNAPQAVSAVQLKAYWSRIIFTGRGKPPKAVANGVELRKLIAADIQKIGYIEHELVDDSVRVVKVQ